MQIQLRIECDGVERRFCKAEGPLVIGRRSGGATVDVDLSGDNAVSRLHARIWHERGEFWIEDIGSAHGTRLNGEEIMGCGAKRLEFNQSVWIGKTKIQLEKPESAAPSVLEVEVFRDSQVQPKSAGDASGFTVVGCLNADQSGVVERDGSTALETQLDLLCELALKLGAEPQLNRALQVAVDQSVCIIPGAQRGAILLVERGSERLMLKARCPADYRPSERLARRAIERREGFAWALNNVGELTEFGAVGNGMYVPLLNGGEAIGALCVDAPESHVVFGETDLRVLRAIGQFISMTLEQHQARTSLARQADFTNRLFCSRFPEKVRQTLLVGSAEGTLPIGTRQSVVTVLQSDIRGFTRLSEEIGPQRLSDLLNAYFPPMVEAVFAFGGSVERFVGDAIFAVFGSPEADSEQQEHAVRAALAIQEAAAEVSAFRVKRKQPTCGIGIGIDCGEVVHGFFGNADSIEFTVIGEAANYASRYCAGASAGEILVSSNVHSHVWKQVDSERRIVEAKHEGEIEAHIIKAWRARAEPR